MRRVDPMTRLAVMLTTALLARPAAVRAQPMGDITALRREVVAGALARAREQERMGRALDAEGSYRDALVADPASLDAAIGYARLLRARGHRDEALATLRSLPPRALADDAALTTLAEVWVSFGRGDEAVALLRDRARGPVGWRALATLAARQGAFAEALAAARRVVDGGDASRAAGLTVRALTQLSAELDVVRRPPPGTTAALRRWLADDRAEPRGW
jgi:tetratricopeptide (TPR) repeat protein